MPAAAAQAAADTAAAGLASPALAEAIEHWHEYYLLAGTAAVTLVGLLFVALSFHLDTLLQDEKAHLLGAARLAFSNFLFVMLMSLTFLAPGLRPKMLDVVLLAVSAVLLVRTLWEIVRHRQRAVHGAEDRFLRQRYMVSGFVAGLSILSAVRFLQHPQASWFFNFAFIVALMLVNAATISWDLLVQVGRQKLARERASRA